MARSNVRDFVASFNKDLAKTARFDVFIPVPFVMAPFFSDMGTKLTLRCENTQMPGRTFATAERKIGSVPIQKLPYQTTYNDISMTFIVGGDMKEKLFFDQWQELMNPASNYNFRYKFDYTTEIAINQYDHQNNMVYRAVLIDAFPLAVNEMDLDWSSEGHHKLTVLFGYSSWQLGEIKGILENAGLNAIQTFLGG